MILGNVPLDRLDDTKLTIGKEYPINFSKQKKKFILVYTVIDATVIYLLMVWKSINSKQKILNKMHIHYVWVFQKILQPII